MTKRVLIVGTAMVFLVAGGLVTPLPAQKQKQGATVKIHHGVVAGMEKVDLKDNSKMKGAMVGGTLAYATTSSSKSGKKTRRNVAAGAAVGGAIAGSRQSETGMLYTVKIAGGAIQVVTDQTEIRMGDCVVVEESSGGANIRRASPEVCEPDAQDLVEELEQEFQEEAAECLEAKEQLLAAETDEDFDRAHSKVQILCEG